MGVIPIIRVDSTETAIRIAEALAAAGLGIVEITMTVPNAIDALASVSRRFGSDVLLGAGTITSVEMADAAIDAGAEFLVTPCLLPGVIARAGTRDVAVLPGALTPTEIFSASQAGADFVKVFPAHAVGGPAYLRAIRGPFPLIPLVPTGGVSLETIADYIAAGAAAVGVGGELVHPHFLKAGDFRAIGALGKRFVEAVKSARTG